MKLSKSFIIFIVALFVVVLLFQLSAPPKYSWKETFGAKDKNPFGCYVFDSVMRASTHDRYTVSTRTLAQISKDEETHSVLLSEATSFDRIDIISIKNICHKGATVMIASSSNYNDTQFEEAFGMVTDGGYYLDFDKLKQSFLNDSNNYKNSIIWNGKGYDKQSYPSNSLIATGYVSLQKDKKQFKVLAFRTLSYNEIGGENVSVDKCPPIAVSRKIGKGTLILTSSPLLFTNYAITSKDIMTPYYVMRMMSQMKGLPIERTTAYISGSRSEEEVSPLSFFLNQKPLRTALYISLLLIVVFMIFTARRRQRIIPIITKPVNRSLDFVKQIGMMYYQHHDNAYLVGRKFDFICSDLRRIYDIDILDNEADERNFAIISQQTGLSKERIKEIILHARYAHNGAYISDKEMMTFIDELNSLTIATE
jgi:hypothetical protein